MKLYIGTIIYLTVNQWKKKEDTLQSKYSIKIISNINLLMILVTVGKYKTYIILKPEVSHKIS